MERIGAAAAAANDAPALVATVATLLSADVDAKGSTARRRRATAIRLFIRRVTVPLFFSGAQCLNCLEFQEKNL
jgi:hypothetical protein